MKLDPPTLPRSIPPQPAVAWFLRDLVPDETWDKFDIGELKKGQILKTQTFLTQYGGPDAWLRFVEQTRLVLPQMLAIALSSLIPPKIAQLKTLPPAITVTCHPVLSVYAGGRTTGDGIALACVAHFRFISAGQPASGEYARALTLFRLKHAGQNLIERVEGEFFVPV